MTQVVTELVIDARGAEQGSAAYVRAMRAAQAAADRVIDQEKRAQDAIQQQTMLMGGQAASIGKVSREYQRLAQIADPALAAQIARQRDLERATLAVDNAVKRGVATQEQASTVLAFYNKQISDAVAKAREKAAADELLNSKMAAQADIAARAAAVQRAASSQAQINASFGIGSGVVGRGDDIVAYGAALDRLRAKYNPVFAASRQYKDALLEIAYASKVGAINEAERFAAMERAKSAMAAQVAAIKGVTQATNEIGTAGGAAVSANDNIARTSGLARHELINLGRQVQDIGVSLASGQSPLTVLVQQGTQVADVFASSNSTVKGFASQVMSVITPLRVGMVGLVGAVVTGALAWMRYGDAQREAARSLVGLGRDAGLTVDRLNAISEAAARASNTSIARSRETIAALAGTGRVGPNMLAPIQGIQKDFAATLGVDAAEANKLLAASFSDPIRGAEMLNERLGGLTNRTRTYIAEMMASGREQEAQKALLDAFVPRLGKAAELTGFWAREWARVSGAASDALDILGKLLDRATSKPAGKTLLQEAEDRLAALQAQAQGMVVDRTNGRVLGGLSSFGPTQDDLQREGDGRKRISAELEIQRAAMHAIKAGQDALNLAVERQVGMEAEIARQRRSIDTGTAAARSLGLPERQQVDQVTELANRYRELYRAKEAAYQRQGSSATGFEDYQRARSEMMSAQRALRDVLQDNGRGVFARDGALLLENNQILERRITLQEQVNQRAQVERQGITAVTAQEQARAAAAREVQQAREQGASAGSAELVAAKALAAAETVRVGISHQLLMAARDRIRSTQMQIEALRAETAAMGGSIATQERVRLETQLINDAKREYARLGLQMPQAEIDHYKRLADEMGRARQAQAELRVMRDLAFEMQQFGRSDTERNVAYQLRNLYGDQYQSQMNGAIAAQIRFNEQLRLTTDLAQDFGRTFVTDILNGKSATEALGNAMKNLAARLIQMAMDQAIKSLFGGLMSVLGGALGLGGSGGTMSMFGLYANGSAFAGGNVVPFAKGGAFTNSIVDRPTVFPMARGAGLMGEAGPEGVLPLKRNARGQLGVIAQGGGGAPAATTIRMGDTSITINGNADQTTLAAIRDELDRRDQRMKAELPSLVRSDRRARLLKGA